MSDSNGGDSVASAAEVLSAPGKEKAEPTRRLVTIMLILADAGSVGIGPIALADAVGFGDLADGVPRDEKAKKDQVARDIRALRKRGQVIDNVAEEGADARYVLRPGDDRFRLELTEPQQVELRRAELVSTYAADTDQSGDGPQTGSGWAPMLQVPAPPTRLDDLMQALRRRSRVRFTYSGKPRVVHPAAVRPLQRDWVLFGWEEASGRVKNFSVGKMSGVDLDPPGTATRQVQSDELTAWPLAWRIDDPVIARLEVPEVFRQDVEQLLGAADEADEDGDVVVMRYTVTNRRVFLARVFELDFRVRLIGDEQMREEARRVLTEAMH